MKRKVLIVIYIILILVTLKLLYNVIIDSILINNYNKGKYSNSQAKALTFFNFPDLKKYLNFPRKVFLYSK